MQSRHTPSHGSSRRQAGPYTRHHAADPMPPPQVIAPCTPGLARDSLVRSARAPARNRRPDGPGRAGVRRGAAVRRRADRAAGAVSGTVAVTRANGSALSPAARTSLGPGSGSRRSARRPRWSICRASAGSVGCRRRSCCTSHRRRDHRHRRRGRQWHDRPHPRARLQVSLACRVVDPSGQAVASAGGSATFGYAARRQRVRHRRLPIVRERRADLPGRPFQPDQWPRSGADGARRRRR